MKKRTGMAAALAVVLAAGGALAQQVKLDPDLAAYKAVSGVSGNISSVGSDTCLLYTSPSPRDGLLSRMPSSA